MDRPHSDLESTCFSVEFFPNCRFLELRTFIYVQHFDLLSYLICFLCYYLAKHSLNKIKEAVQRRRARAKEAEEEDNKREAKKEDRKVKKEEKDKESLPTKQSADAGGGHPQRKSQRLTKDKQKQKESEEEEEDKDSKETKAAQMKSKSRAKVSDGTTKESEDASNDEDDLVKGIAVKNVKVQMGKRGSTSNEELCERKETDKVDAKETKKRIKKGQKSADVTNKDVANNDGRNSESEVLIEERKLLENVPKSKSSVSLRLKNRLDAREANNEEAKGKGKSKSLIVHCLISLTNVLKNMPFGI